MAEMNDHAAANNDCDITVKTRTVNGPLRLNDSAPNLTEQRRWESIEETAKYLLSQTNHRPRIAIILGSGLGSLASLLRDVVEFPYRCIPNFIQTGVKGHAGRLLFGELANKSVVCMQGRIHAYEGHSMWQTTFPIRVFHAIGVQVMLVTNASGSIRADFRPGDVVIIKDHINLPGLASLNPLFGLNDDRPTCMLRVRFGERFPAMSTAYDPQLRALTNQVADELGMKSFVYDGIYFYQAGPCFETIAECNMAKSLGGDVVGMSTCPEVLVARHGQRPMRCIGLSLITNQCVMDYDCLSTANHDEVLEVACQRAEDLQRLVSTLIARISID